MGDENGTQLGGMDKPMNILALLALGIILIVIGFDARASGAVDAGLIFTTLALFGGALLLKLDGYVRLGMLIAGGLILSSLALSLASF